MLTRIVVDRSETEAATAIGITSLAFLFALPVFDPDIRSAFGMLAGTLGAGVLVIAGFAAASRVRPMSKRAIGEVPPLLGRTFALGVLMALINLAVNRGMASLDPTLHQLLVERFGRIPPSVSVLAAPVIEEVMLRLFFLSVVAVVVARFVKDRRVVFWTALALSAFVFGLLHVLRPEPESLDLVWIYRLGVTLKSSIGGVLLGWIFWRWGLGYSIVCHGTVNGVHSSLEPVVFDF